MRTLCSDMPYQEYAYGYHIPPIVKEKMPLRASVVIVNNRQHQYHSSDTDRTCICQFCLTSHSITSMGHARLVEILQISCIFCFLAGVPLGVVLLHIGLALSLSLSLSLCVRYIKETIMYFGYTVIPRPHTLGPTVNTGKSCSRR